MNYATIARWIRRGEFRINIRVSSTFSFSKKKEISLFCRMKEKVTAATTAAMFEEKSTLKYPNMNLKRQIILTQIVTAFKREIFRKLLQQFQSNYKS